MATIKRFEDLEISVGQRAVWWFQ